jgi:hypothetical protein
MEHRYILYDNAGDKIGVLWKDKDYNPKVLFALKDGQFETPKGIEKIFDMVDKKYIETKKKSLNFQARHIYLFDPAKEVILNRKDK